MGQTAATFETFGIEYLTGARFYFEFQGEGGELLLISKVSGLSITIDVAGQGQPLGCTKGAITKTQYTPSGTTYENLTLEFVTMAENDSLLNWYLDSHPKAYMGGATEAWEKRSSASLVFYRQNGDEGARYNIRNALPVKYTSTQVSAESTDLFKETIEIMHAGIIRDLSITYAGGGGGGGV